MRDAASCQRCDADRWGLVRESSASVARRVAAELTGRHLLLVGFNVLTTVAAAQDVVVTADSAILDRGVRWFDLANHTVAAIENRWVIDFTAAILP